MSTPELEVNVVRRADVLDLAVLGLLHDSPLHGYELRKRLASVLGPFRALSYGTLYPCLKHLSQQGLITQSSGDAGSSTAGRRARIVYELTAAGKEHFETLVDESGPTSWEDESFGVRFAFFSRTPTEVRLRILEGRRSRLEERLDAVSASVTRGRERADQYTLELQRHGLESVQREVRWLNELITNERQITTASGSAPSVPTPTDSSPQIHPEKDN
jgi:DNA-binding PadR family transcriptional regulator